MLCLKTMWKPWWLYATVWQSFITHNTLGIRMGQIANPVKSSVSIQYHTHYSHFSFLAACVKSSYMSKFLQIYIFLEPESGSLFTFTTLFSVVVFGLLFSSLFFSLNKPLLNHWLLFFPLSFLFFKLWKYDNTFLGDLENREQSYL